MTHSPMKDLLVIRINWHVGRGDGATLVAFVPGDNRFAGYKCASDATESYAVGKKRARYWTWQSRREKGSHNVGPFACLLGFLSTREGFLNFQPEADCRFQRFGWRDEPPLRPASLFLHFAPFLEA